MFFGLPIAWHLVLCKLDGLAGLRHAVPEWPVVFAMAVAFGWRHFKTVYVAIAGEDNLGTYGDGGFYWSFVEQINEHKEMLLATAILSYAIYRLRPPRIIQAPPEDAP